MFPWIEHHHTVCCSAHISLLSTRRSVFVTRSILMWHLIKVSPFDALPPSVCIVLQTCSCSLSPPPSFSRSLFPSLPLFSVSSLSVLSYTLSLSLTCSHSCSLALLLFLSPSPLSLSLYCLTTSLYLYWLTLSLSLPFRHIGHVGWDPNTGFDVSQLLHICIQIDSQNGQRRYTAKLNSQPCLSKNIFWGETVNRNNPDSTPRKKGWK